MTTKFRALISVIGLASISLVQAQLLVPGGSPDASSSPTKHRAHKKAEPTASPAEETASPSTAESPAEATASPAEEAASVADVGSGGSQPPPRPDAGQHGGGLSQHLHGRSGDLGVLTRIAHHCGDVRVTPWLREGR